MVQQAGENSHDTRILNGTSRHAGCMVSDTLASDKEDIDILLVYCVSFDS